VTCCLTEYHKKTQQAGKKIITANDIKPEGQRCQLKQIQMAQDLLFKESHNQSQKMGQKITRILITNNSKNSAESGNGQ
jgi:hypothetical protein